MSGKKKTFSPELLSSLSDKSKYSGSSVSDKTLSNTVGAKKTFDPTALAGLGATSKYAGTAPKAAAPITQPVSTQKPKTPATPADVAGFHGVSSKKTTDPLALLREANEAEQAAQKVKKSNRAAFTTDEDDYTPAGDVRIQQNQERDPVYEAYDAQTVADYDSLMLIAANKRLEAAKDLYESNPTEENYRLYKVAAEKAGKKAVKYAASTQTKQAAYSRALKEGDAGVAESVSKAEQLTALQNAKRIDPTLDTGGLTDTEVNQANTTARLRSAALSSIKSDATYESTMSKAFDAPDFDKKSRYRSTAIKGAETKTSKQTFLGSMNERNVLTKSGFKDAFYDAVNGNPAALEEVHIMYGTDSDSYTYSWGTLIENMTPSEKQVYNYYHGISKDKEKEFLKFLKPYLVARAREKGQAAIARDLEKNPVLAGAVYSGVSVVTKPYASALKNLENTTAVLTGNEISPNTQASQGYNMNADMRNSVSRLVEDKWGKFGSAAYGVGMSIADNLYARLLSGGRSGGKAAGEIVQLIMSSSAAADTTMSALDRGVSSGEAFTLGLLAAGIEAATEGLGIDAWLDANTLKQSVYKYIGQNIVAEGAEEGLSNLANLAADIWLSKGRSEWEQSIRDYKAAHPGTTREEALKQAYLSHAAELGLDIVSGMASGGITSTVAGAPAIAQDVADSARTAKLKRSGELNYPGVQDGAVLYDPETGLIRPRATAPVDIADSPKYTDTKAKDGTTILSEAATAFVNAGMRADTAQKKAEVVRKLVAGEEVSELEINTLEPTNPKMRALFSELTGVQFPEGKLSPKQLYDLYRSAAQVAQTQVAETVAAEVEAAAEEAQNQPVNDVQQTPATDTAAVETNPVAETAESQFDRMREMNVPLNPEFQDREADIGEPLRRAVAALDMDGNGNRLATQSEFIKQAKVYFPDSTKKELKTLYQEYRDGTRTVLFNGQRMTKAAFSDMLWSELWDENLSDKKIDVLFNVAILSNMDGHDAFDAFVLSEEELAAKEAGAEKPASSRERTSRNQLPLSNGSTITREQYKAYKKDTGTDMSDAQLDGVFDALLGLADQGDTIPYDEAMANYMKEEQVPGGQATEKAAESRFQDKRTEKGKAVSKKVLRALETFADTFGVRVELVDSIATPGKKSGANGQFVPRENKILLAADSENPLLTVLKHEITHYIKKNNPAQYKAFKQYVMEAFYNNSQEEMNAAIKARLDLAKAHNVTLTRGEAMDEIVADATERFLTDRESIEALVRENRSLAEAILDAIRAVLRMLEEAMTGANMRGYSDFMNAEQLRQAEKMWVEALASASMEDGVGIQYDDASESVAPIWSLKTWNESEYVKAREEAAKTIAKQLGITKEKALAYIDDINGIARLIADDQVRLDYDSNLDENATVLKPNSDYKFSVDMSTLCAKRLLFTGTFDAIQKAMPNTVFDSDDIVRLRKMMMDKNLEVACGICYVESTRREIGRITQDFIDRYKEAQKTGKPITRLNSEGKAVDLKKTKDQMDSTADKSTDKFFADKDYTPTLADLNTTDIDMVKRDHPLVYEAYLNFMNARGQAKPKLLETRAEYKGEILKHFKYKSAVKSRNEHGGLRLQSFSDFEVPHMIDMMQVIMDMSRVGLQSQAYTKVPAFAEVFGDTGVKINLSLIAKGDGLDSKGNLLFDDVEGMNHKEAFRLRDQYSDNVGTILVGKNDAHIIAAMADPRIDFIIPFHKSSWKESLYDALGLTGYSDYTDTQNEKPVDKDRKISNFDPSEYWDFTKTGDENAQIYLEKCREDGRVPKFPQFQGYPGYWKLLIDFKMYNNDGVGSPQTVVRPDFNMDAASKILNDYEGGHRSFPVAKDVVNEFVSEYRAQKNATEDGGGSYSLKLGRFADISIDTQKDVNFFGIKSLNDFIGVQKTVYRKLQEINFFDATTKRRTVENADTGIVVEITRDGIFETFGPEKRYAWLPAELKRLKIATVRYLPDIIKYGEVVDADTDNIHNPKSSVTYTYLEHPITVAGKTLYAVVDIRQSPEKNKFWVHHIHVDTKKGQVLAANADESASALNEDLTYGDNVAHQEEVVKKKDSEYLAAVDRGDMVAAQKMVDEAAKAAGFPVRLLHGTQRFGFTKVDTSESDDSLSFFATDEVETAQSYSALGGKRMISGEADYDSIDEAYERLEESAQDAAGDLASALSRWAGYYNFVESDYIHDRFMEIADDYKGGKLSKEDADNQMYEFADDIIANGYNEDSYDGQEFWEWQGSDEAEKLYTEVNKTISKYLALADFDMNSADSGNYDIYANTDGLMVIDCKGGKWDNIQSEVLPDITSEEYKKYGYRGHRNTWTTRSASKYAKDNGYKGVKFANVFDDGGRGNAITKPADVYSFFYPQSQVKSADPVTYDDDGNVIPLSERFNSENADLRYSLKGEQDIQARLESVAKANGVTAESYLAALKEIYGDKLNDDLIARRLTVAEERIREAEESKAAERSIRAAEKRDAELGWEVWFKKNLRAVKQANADKVKAVKEKAKTEKSEALKTQKTIADAEKAVALEKQREEMTEALKNKDLAWRIESERRVRQAKSAEKTKADERVRQVKQKAKEDARKAKEIANAEKKAAVDKAVQHERLMARKQGRLFAYNLMKANRKIKNAAEVKPALTPSEQAETKPTTFLTGLRNRAEVAGNKLRRAASFVYSRLVNDAMHIDAFAKLQKGIGNADAMVNQVRNVESRVNYIMAKELVDPLTNEVIGVSGREALLCLKANKNGRRQTLDKPMQAILQRGLLVRHHIDRMLLEAKALQRIEDFVAKHPGVAKMKTSDMQKIIALTEQEAKQNGLTEARNILMEYFDLVQQFNNTKNKPVIGDGKNPISVEGAQAELDVLMRENPWLEEKMDGVYKWWDAFMKAYVAGTLVSQESYNQFREMYPHYVPTFRAKYSGVGGVSRSSNNIGTTTPIKKATGGISEVQSIELSFLELTRKFVKQWTLETMYGNMVDSVVKDTDGAFAGIAWVVDDEGNPLTIEGTDGKELTESETLDESEGAVGEDGITIPSKVREERNVTNVGNKWYLTSRNGGKPVRIGISEDLAWSLQQLTGTHKFSETQRKAVALGRSITNLPKMFITGINPAFAIRNVSKDFPTAVYNTTAKNMGEYLKRYGYALSHIKRNSKEWRDFVIMGGAGSTQLANESGLATKDTAKMLAKAGKLTTKDVLQIPGEYLEAVPRFAEYLSTISRLGDDYKGRVQAIKNAAEVTVDFSRHGSVGKVINSFCLYWNPKVQGLDKAIRQTLDTRDGRALVKHVFTYFGRVVAFNIIAEGFMYAVLKALGKYDEWEELDDRTKDTYYCFPCGEYGWIKIKRSEFWGTVIGVPIMRTIAKLEGREKAFENYLRGSLGPNVSPVPGARDIPVVSQWVDSLTNKDFAGRTIVPQSMDGLDAKDKYTTDTSYLARAVGSVLNTEAFSPILIDHYLESLFSDWGEYAIQATSEATWTGDRNFGHAVWDIIRSPFVADTRYQNAAVSKYYDTLEELENTVKTAGKRHEDLMARAENSGDPETYIRENYDRYDFDAGDVDGLIQDYRAETKTVVNNSREQQTLDALDKLYGGDISELNKQARNLPKNDEKDRIKGEIAELAAAALIYYDQCVDGTISNPKIDATYSAYSAPVVGAMEELDAYAKQYNFEPNWAPEKTYTDPNKDGYEYILTDDQKDYAKTLYIQVYEEMFGEETSRSRYKNASGEEKAAILEGMKADVLEEVKDELFRWLRKSGVKSTKKQTKLKR